MRKPIHIFINTREDLHDFVSELESLLGVSFMLQDGYYEFLDESKQITLGPHEFAPDRNINFEDYAYDIEINIYDRGDEAQYERARLELGQAIFDKLEAVQTYPLMMVDDLQNKMREYHPVEMSMNQ